MMYNFNKIVRKGLYFCLIIFLSTNLSATTMHAVVFAGTDDYSIGKGNRVSHRLITDELHRIHKIENGIDVEIYNFTGTDFNIDNVSVIKNQLKSENGNLENDILFFIFIGHGFNLVTELLDYPNLLFLNSTNMESEEDINNNSMPFKQIIEEFRGQLSPKLFIAYAEACNNNYLEGEKMLTSNSTTSSNSSTYDAISTATANSRPVEKFKELFLDQSGLVVFTSSAPSEPSYVHDRRGGVYSQSFVKALQQETSVGNNEVASFKSIYNQSKKNVEKVTDKYGLIQNPQYLNNLVSQAAEEKQLSEDPPKQKKRGLIAWLVAKLAPNKLKKQMKKAFKEGDLVSIGMVLNPDEPGDRMRKKMHLKNPLMYYTQEALVKEEMGKSAEAYKYFSVASELWEQGYKTKNDERLMEQMKDLDEDNLTGIRSFSSYPRWLQNKLGFYKEGFEGKIAVEDDKISKYKADIKKLEADILEDNKAIESLRAESDSIKAEIEKIDIPREKEVKVELGDLSKLSNSTLQELRQVIRNGRQVADDAPTSTEEVVIGDSEAIVKFEYKKGRMSSNIEPNVGGYKVAQYCNADIINFTSDLMAVLLVKLDEVPPTSRDAIGIKLQVIGNADWRGGVTKKIIRFRADEAISEEFKTLDGETNYFNIEAGETRMISNRELAFLRAYCAYRTTLGILQEKGIRAEKVEAYFTAEVHSKPPNANASNMEDGKEDRGIEISMMIENLYKHHMDEIKRLKSRLEIIQGEVKQKEDNIAENKVKVESLEGKVALAEKEKERLERIVDDAQTDKGTNTPAGSILQQVKDAW